eukprot:SAG31_NODE_5684_length_2381_cov_1.847940_3_plen_303_part_00
MHSRWHARTASVPALGHRCPLLLVAIASAAAPAVAEGFPDVLLDGGAGLQWALKQQGEASYALGAPLLHGEAVDSRHPVDDGIAFWRRQSDFLVVPVKARTIELDRTRSNSSAVLTGHADLPAGSGSVATTVVVTVRLHPGAVASASLSLSFKVAAPAEGWQLCFKWAQDGAAADAWRAQGYPWASNSSKVQRSNLNYMGWPGFFLYRPDARVVAWWGLSIQEDFTNPNTWTAATAFWMDAPGGGAHQIAPQFAFGGGNISAAGVWHNATTRLIFSAAGETLAAVTDIVPGKGLLSRFCTNH